MAQVAGATEVHQQAASAYDRITKQHADEDIEAVVPYRHFNNYIKKSLIQYASGLQIPSRLAASGFSVLDLASGRGGDVGKWLFTHKAGPLPPKGKPAPPPPQRVLRYVGVDISSECITEAKRRVEKVLSGSPVDFANVTVGEFCGNCLSKSFWATEGPAPTPSTGSDSAFTLNSIHELSSKDEDSRRLAPPFDVVSCQFAFHYGCDSQESVNALFTGIAAAMAPGGVMLLTVVDSDALARRVSAPPTSGNSNGGVQSLFEVSFLTPQPTSTSGVVPLSVGVPYYFKLEGHVDAVEYCIPMSSLDEAAARAGLVAVPELTFTFASKLKDYESDPRVQRQLKGATLSTAEKELISMYRTAVYRRPL
jgi:mRNA (guanine-N7-)-methyltransferase